MVPRKFSTSAYILTRSWLVEEIMVAEEPHVAIRENLTCSKRGAQVVLFSVAIIGGGLVGLTLSIGLTCFGISYGIYKPTKCFSEIGAGIAMGPTAVWSLGLIDSQLRESYDRC